MRSIEADRRIVDEVRLDGFGEFGPADRAASLQQAEIPQAEKEQKLKATLSKMEENMKTTANSTDGPSDQWAVYRHIVGCFESGRWARLIIQASAGTGKTYVNQAICIWLELYGVHYGLKCNASAPTGIAAANLEVPDTDITDRASAVLLAGNVSQAAIGYHVKLPLA